MKAVIMAGGEGARLRPLTLERPKPMMMLCGRPVLEHIVLLLLKNGIKDIAVTLKYMPEAVFDHFGDGEKWGVNMTYFVEDAPMGTAGSVKACEKFIGEEDFVVISGDAVCDIDLKQAEKAHKENAADVTIVTCRHKDPLEYGIVLSANDGRIEGFVEKPDWKQVMSDKVNTGIYVIKPDVLREIPEEENYDFSRDLFPKLMEKGLKLCAFDTPGYWCDMGEARAYLKCTHDALSGKIGISFPAPGIMDGVYSKSSIPEDIKIIPPCYIGENVRFGNRAVIGPNTVIEDGSTVGCEAFIERSIVSGADIGARAYLHGAIVCKDVKVRDGARLFDGSITGAKSVVGECATILENAVIWPEKEIDKGNVVYCDSLPGAEHKTARFDDDGAIYGKTGYELTPEFLYRLGMALGKTLSSCVVSAYDAPETAAAAFCVFSGMIMSGGKCISADAKNAAAASFCATAFKAKASIMIEKEEDTVVIRAFGEDSLPISRDVRRKIEKAITSGEHFHIEKRAPRKLLKARGTDEMYIAGAFRDLSGVEVYIDSDDDGVLKKALESFGASVLKKAQRGKASFSVSRDGNRLSITDEEGTCIDPQRAFMISAMCAYDREGGKIAVPYDFPSAFDDLAAENGFKLLRVGRDGKDAQMLYSRQRFMRDGVYAAAEILGYMKEKGVLISDLSKKLPQFERAQKDVPVSSNRAAVMAALSESCFGMAKELCEGVRLCTDNGWIHIYPASKEAALRVMGESADMETAEELCGIFEDRIKTLDKKVKRRVLEGKG